MSILEIALLSYIVFSWITLPIFYRNKNNNWWVIIGHIITNPIVLVYMIYYLIKGE